jgi:hypothetical protein
MYFTDASSINIFQNQGLCGKKKGGGGGWLGYTAQKEIK